MLPKKRRLNTKAFATYFSQGFFVSSPLFSLRVKTLENQEISRFSVVVSQKVTKNKPKRNHLKRQLYTIVSPFIPRLKTPQAIIIFVKKEALTSTFSRLSEEMIGVLKKEKLLN